MSLKEPEYDNEHMVGAARRKSKYPRKILRVILSDGTCRLQPQLTPDDIKVKEEDWNYYNHGNEYQDYDESIPEVIPSVDHLSTHHTIEEHSTHHTPTHHTPTVLGTHHATNELPPHHVTDDHISRHTNEQKDHPLKGLSDLRLTDSRLTDSRLTDSRLTDSRLTDSRLNESRLNDTRLNDSRLNDSRLNESRLNDTRLNDSRLNDSRLNDSRLNESRLNESRLNDSRLNESRLNESRLNESRLTDSRHDAENRYYDTNDSLVYLHDKNIKIENSSLLNSRLRANDKPKDNTRPHKHQHPEPTPDFPYQCDTCDMLFKTIDLLTDHQTTVHHNNRQFACRYCSKRFNDKYNMRKHVLIHVGEKRHRCQFCDKAFLRKDHLRSHLQTHYNRKFGCKVCGKSFRTLDMYQRHAKTHKTSPSLTMSNDNPESTYPDLINLQKLDNSAAIQNGANNRSKEDSNDTTNVDNGDSLHISNVTSQYGKDLSPGVSKLENFPVTILDEDFNEFWRNSPSVSENDLSITSSPVSSDLNHSFVNGDSPKTEGFSCHICNSSFKTDLSLQLHSQKCSGEIRNWQCIKCNIIFDEAKTLKQHYEKVHSVEEPIPSPSRWRCKTCNINYPNSKELSRHYAQAHKDAQIFPCSECPKTFTVWHNLKKHMLIHLGDKKHKCTVCEKGFVRKDHLNSHMKVHLGDGSKFTCPICCKVFRLKQMYLKHMNLHGLEQAYDDSKE